jgi:hypothetical protein
MFLIAVSTFPFKRVILSNNRLETLIIGGKDFNILLIFDPKKLNLSKTNSRLLLIESQFLLEGAQVAELLDFQFQFQKLVEKLILLAIGVDIKDKRVKIVTSLLNLLPLYYHVTENGNSIYISTHIKLLKEVGVKIQEEVKASAEYLIFGGTLAPFTLYKGIKKTFRGQMLEIHSKNNTLCLQTKDFPLSFKKNQSMKEDEILQKINEILTSSFAKLKSYPKKVAMSFSGGLDTSILAKILKNENIEANYYSLSYPFEDKEKSLEKQYATSAGQALQLNNTHLFVDRREYLNSLIDLIAEGEEPLWLYLQQPLFCAMLKRLQKEKKILYFTKHFPANLLVLLRSKDSKFIKRCLVISSLKYPLIKTVVRVILRFLHKDPKPLESMASAKTDTELSDPKYLLWELLKLGDVEWVTHKFNTSLEEIVSRQAQALTPYKQYSMLDLFSIYLGMGQILMNIDTTLKKFGEKHGKKIFFPFFNDLLVYYSFQIPWKTKLKGPKYILRRLAKRIGVPKFIITRPKIGFPTKAEDWALPGKFMECFVPICKNYFTEKEIRGMQSKDPSKYATFWFMINYSIWKEIFIENKSPEILKKQLNDILEKN